jgi:hypothetical protein
VTVTFVNQGGSMKRATIAVAAIAMLAVLAPIASAGSKINTTVTFQGMDFYNVPGRAAHRALGSYIFYGQVKSPNARCAKGRKVVVRYRVGDGKFKLLGSDMSDSGGSWALRIDFTKYPPGAGEHSFKANAPKRRLSASKVCKADTSNVLTPA